MNEKNASFLYLLIRNRSQPDIRAWSLGRIVNNVQTMQATVLHAGYLFRTYDEHGNVLFICFPRYDEYENCTVFSFLVGLLILNKTRCRMEPRCLAPSVLTLVRLVLRCGRQGTGDHHISRIEGEKRRGEKQHTQRSFFSMRSGAKILRVITCASICLEIR